MGDTSQEYENAPVTPLSFEAKKILSEINIVEEAKKVESIKITCPILGAGEHHEDGYKVRKAVKERITTLGHSPFFPENITAKDTEKFLIEQGISGTVAKVFAGTDERKNDAILKASSIIFAVATDQGVLLEIAKCCNTVNEDKLRVLLPLDKYHELSQVSQTMQELEKIWENVYTFKDNKELEKCVDEIMDKELCRHVRKNMR